MFAFQQSSKEHSLRVIAKMRKGAIYFSLLYSTY